MTTSSQMKNVTFGKRIIFCVQNASGYHLGPVAPSAYDKSSFKYVLLTAQVGRVDVVLAVKLRIWGQDDPGGVGGQEVGASILGLVADSQGRAVLALSRSV